MLQNPNDRKINIHEYINNPHLFLEKMIEKLQISKKRITNRDFNDFLGDSLQKSEVTMSDHNPIIVSQLLLRGMTFDEFKRRRPELRIADQTYVNKIITNDITIDDGSIFYKLKNENVAKFNEISYLFSSVFTLLTDPYSKARAICQAYSIILLLSVK